MIALASDFLLFQVSGGESVPFSADMVSVQLAGQSVGLFDEEFLRHASHAVFHYFKHELRREEVSMGEFAGAMEKVLQGFALNVGTATKQSAAPVVESDLDRLASESCGGCELFFFPRLREELLEKLQTSPRLLRFRGLRSCVKQLAGVQRWTQRCRGLEEQIVEYLRQCLNAQAEHRGLSMVVE